MKLLRPILSWLITLLIPVALTFLGLRLLLSNAFLEIEYRLPGFPEDTYGFTLEDRLQWSKIALEYLLNDAELLYLGGLTFPDGSPLYNQRELRHMLDVKNLLRTIMWTGYGVWLAVLGLGLWAQWGDWWLDYLRGLRLGGWLTGGLVVAIAAFAVLSFLQFFTLFHTLFFEGDSWLFLYSDTLIRLFPVRFWQDVFIVVGVVAVGSGLALGLGLKPKKG